MGERFDLHMDEHTSTRTIIHITVVEMKGHTNELAGEEVSASLGGCSMC